MRIPEAFKDWVRQRLASLVRVSKYTRATATGLADHVEGYGTLPNEPDDSRQANRAEPFGLRSIPIPGDCEGVLLLVHGGSSNGVIVGQINTKYGSNDLSSGDVQLYSAATDNTILLLGGGGIIATSATGTNILVNAGTGGRV